jgi:MFS family permease
MKSTSPWVVFAIASAAVFLVSVDATIAVAAFPALRGSFADTSPATLSWVLNAYTILYAALLVPAGRLVDLHGAKRLFLFGVALFTLASAACGTAPGTGALIAARTVQAVGGAVLTPASLALILGAFPPGKRSAIVGLWSAAGAQGRS